MSALHNPKGRLVSRPFFLPAESHGSNSNSFARTFPASIISLPTLTGNLKRRGPALPGLKYRTPFFSSIFG